MLRPKLAVFVKVGAHAAANDNDVRLEHGSWRCWEAARQSWTMIGQTGSPLGMSSAKAAIAFHNGFARQILGVGLPLKSNGMVAPPASPTVIVYDAVHYQGGCRCRC